MFYLLLQSVFDQVENILMGKTSLVISDFKGFSPFSWKCIYYAGLVQTRNTTQSWWKGYMCSSQAIIELLQKHSLSTDVWSCCCFLDCLVHRAKFQGYLFHFSESIKALTGIFRTLTHTIVTPIGADVILVSVNLVRSFSLSSLSEYHWIQSLFQEHFTQGGNTVNQAQFYMYIYTQGQFSVAIDIF